ncbi:MAG: response regulator [Alphaproteobacteria bacterium]|nr:response regulator [Alphaproteobacteria bacterium]
MPRLLIADDNDLMRATLSRLLSPYGAVRAVADGEAALAAAQAQTFDLILLDIKMPGIDGIAACETLRASGFDGPVIALTADGSVERDTRYKAAGFTGLIEKPFAAADLVREVLGALERVKGIEPSS